MSLTQYITEGLHQYAYQPEIVYLLVIVIMLLAGFGLPIPEEMVIITTSMLAYMSLNPIDFPPPEPDSRGINVHILMGVCFFAVFLSDLIVFHLGRHLGKGIHTNKWFQRLIKPKVYRKVKFWTQKYGSAAAAVFRFLPGLRFPGHLACGALGISRWKFIVVDGLIILATVPTQVYLIAHYGEEILEFFHKYKWSIFVLLGVVALYISWTIYKNMKYLSNKHKVRAERRAKMDAL